MAFSLPSIHEMFPEHLLRVSPETRVKGSAPPTHLKLECGFNVLRSDPSASTLTHVSSLNTAGGTSSGPSGSSEGSEGSDGEDDIGSKKHLCTTCNKRFNRPSSLRIHINTHTGATPFRCPFPGCGREFNVNSNMRRHFRNHATTAGSAQLEDDIVSSTPCLRQHRDRSALRHAQLMSPSPPRSPPSPHLPSHTLRSIHHEPYSKSRPVEHRHSRALSRPRTRESDLRTHIA